MNESKNFEKFKTTFYNLSNRSLPLWILRIWAERVVELPILAFVVGDNFSCQFQRGFTWPVLRGRQEMVDCNEREEKNG